MGKLIRIGVGLGKRYLQLLGLTGAGGPAVKRKLSRLKLDA